MYPGPCFVTRALRLRSAVNLWSLAAKRRAATPCLQDGHGGVAPYLVFRQTLRHHVIHWRDSQMKNVRFFRAEGAPFFDHPKTPFWPPGDAEAWCGWAQGNQRPPWRAMPQRRARFSLIAPRSVGFFQVVLDPGWCLVVSLLGPPILYQDSGYFGIPVSFSTMSVCCFRLQKGHPCHLRQLL